MKQVEGFSADNLIKYARFFFRIWAASNIHLDVGTTIILEKIDNLCEMSAYDMQYCHIRTTGGMDR